VRVIELIPTSVFKPFKSLLRRDGRLQYEPGTVSEYFSLLTFKIPIPIFVQLN